MKSIYIWLPLLILSPVLAESAGLRGALLSQAPIVDGNPNDAVWSEAEVVSGFVTTDNKPAVQDTTVKVGYTPDGLYVLFLCNRDDEKELITNAGEPDGDIWGDDEVEVFFDPTGTKAHYFHFMANAAGVKREEYQGDPSWTCDWKTATGKVPGKWVAEMFIPFAPIDVLVVSLKPVWGINFCRNDQQTKQATQWKYTGGAFHRPELFGSFGPLKIDLARCHCRLQMELPNVFWPGTNTVRVNCRSLVGKNDTAETPGKAVLALNVYDASRKLLSHEAVELKASPGSKIIPIQYNLPDAGDFFLEATIRVGGEEKATYSTSFHPIHAIDEPVMFMTQPTDGIVFPPERNTPLRIQVLIPPLVKGDNAGQHQINVRAIQDSGRIWASLPSQPVKNNEAQFDWSIQDWPAGRYRIEATVSAGQFQKTASRELFIVPNDTHNYVRVDEFGRTVVKQPGKEERLFFPIGLYNALFCNASGHDNVMHTLSDSGINALQSYLFFAFRNSECKQYYLSSEQRKQYLDLALQHGMMVLVSVKDNVSPYKPKITPDFIKMPSDSIENTVSQVLNYRHHPAVLSWYAADEPEGASNHCKPSKLEEFYRLLKKLDPLHPVSAAFYSIRPLRDFYDGYDIAMPDYYPYPERVTETYAVVHQHFQGIYKIVNNPKPFWAVLQSYDKKLIELAGEKGKDYPRAYPLYAEIRLMTFQALASGARGIWYFDWKRMGDPKYKQARTDLLRVTKEISALSPVLLAENREFAEIPDTNDVCGIWLNHDGAWYLLLANGALQGRQISVSLPKILTGTADDTVIQILDGKKEQPCTSAKLDNGKLRVTMADMEAMVLKIQTVP